MDEKNKTAMQAPGGSPRLPFDLRLRSLKSSRQSLARILRAWGRGEISEQVAKTSTWLMSMFLAYLKESTSEELEARLAGIERKLGELEGGSHARRVS